jgi:hypothetical protein
MLWPGWSALLPGAASRAGRGPDRRAAPGRRSAARRRPRARAALLLALTLTFAAPPGLLGDGRQWRAVRAGPPRQARPEPRGRGDHGVPVAERGAVAVVPGSAAPAPRQPRGGRPSSDLVPRHPPFQSGCARRSLAPSTGFRGPERLGGGDSECPPRRHTYRYLQRELERSRGIAALSMCGVAPGSLPVDSGG